MDEILGTLFDELSRRIKDCQEKNPLVDMDDVARSCLLIQSYIDGFNNKPFPVDGTPLLPNMSYEELCKLTRPPRITPKGHLGPAYSMIHYAEDNDNRRARRVDQIIQKGKELEKNKDKPFF